MVILCKIVCTCAFLPAVNGIASEAVLPFDGEDNCSYSDCYMLHRRQGVSNIHIHSIYIHRVHSTWPEKEANNMAKPRLGGQMEQPISHGPLLHKDSELKHNGGKGNKILS